MPHCSAENAAKPRCVVTESYAFTLKVRVSLVAVFAGAALW
jgi:hypothetical protein